MTTDLVFWVWVNVNPARIQSTRPVKTGLLPCGITQVTEHEANWTLTMLNEEQTQDGDLDNTDVTSADDKPKSDKEDKVDWRAEFFKLKKETDSKKDEPKEEKKEVKETEKPVTHTDLQKMNERQAVREITTPAPTDPPEEQALKQAIKDNWEEVKTFYVARTGKDVEDIKEDIKDAYLAWARRNPQKASDAKKAIAELTRDGGTRGTASAPATPEKKGPPRTPTGMANWYKKN